MDVHTGVCDAACRLAGCRTPKYACMSDIDAIGMLQNTSVRNDFAVAMKRVIPLNASTPSAGHLHGVCRERFFGNGHVFGQVLHERRVLIVTADHHQP